MSYVLVLATLFLTTKALCFSEATRLYNKAALAYFKGDTEEAHRLYGKAERWFWWPINTLRRPES